MSNDLDGWTDEFIQHLTDVETAFNNASALAGLGVQLDAAELKAKLRAGRSRRCVMTYRSGEGIGVLYREQIATAIDAIREIVDNRWNFGLIIGALQSGKTTTALALQFAGPAVHLISGERVFPFYLTTSQNSHREQLRTELAHFIQMYGDLDIRFDGARCRLRNYLMNRSLDAVFERDPTLNVYREVVLQEQAGFKDIYNPATLDDLIHKRVRGMAIKGLAESCKKMVGAGFTPLMVIDEPQFGASDRQVNGGIVDSLLTQIEKELTKQLGPDAKRVKVIGLSATPFELHALKRIWNVRQYLGPAYSGFARTRIPLDWTEQEKLFGFI